MFIICSKCIDSFLVSIDKALQVFVEIALNIVIVYNVNQEQVVMASLQEVLALFLAVDDSPGVNPRHECLIFPDLECLVINNRWLNNLLTLEDTPGDSVDVSFLHVFKLGATRGVGGLISDVFLWVKEFNQLRDQGFVHEKFDVSFLVDISVPGSPTELSISRFSSVAFWLRINCKELVLIQLDKLRIDLACLSRKTSLGKWELFDLPGEIVNKDAAYFAQACARFTPEFLLFLVVDLLEPLSITDKAILIRSEGWRSTDSPTTIRELVPVLGSQTVALRFNGPEDWSDVLGFSLGRDTCLERQSSRVVHYSKTFDDLDDSCLQIHCVEM